MQKILVIEDSDALRKDILEMLKYEGFDVRGAANGRLGVNLAREYHPDLIICDIMMPELDGYGVLNELQQDGAGITIPFIFLTAKTDRGDVHIGMSLGAGDYITKPFTVSELIARVRKRLEIRDKVAQIADQKLESLRDNIILSMPHEIRTPLTGILGFSDILMSDVQYMGTDQVTEMARYVFDAAQRLYRLMENYLVYAQLGLVVTDPQNISIMRQSTTPEPAVVIESTTIHKAQRYNREADLNLSISDGGAICVMEDSLKKIIEELVDNALKFSLPGKTVSLTGEVCEKYYQITVSDHGRGMKRTNISDIGAFVQFERQTFEQQGSGFGLAIVRKSVELYGGDLHIESIPDKGTTVTVRLPMAEVPQPAPLT